MLTCEGEKAIEELSVGDEVVSSDPEKQNRLAPQRVVRTFKRAVQTIMDVRIGNTIISCTPEHPFWVEGKGWQQASALKPGSRLVTVSGKAVAIDSMREREGNFTVYNFEVENTHAYYV